MWSLFSLKFFTSSSTVSPPWFSALQCQYSITVLEPLPEAVLSAEVVASEVAEPAVVSAEVD